MKPKMPPIIIATVIALATLVPDRLDAQADPDIDFHGVAARLIPISVAGYGGTAQDVLKFDLEVAGFELTTPDRASYSLSNPNPGQVAGQLYNASRKNLLNKAYSGGSVRSQTHTLANDVILAVTGKKGVGNTKIVFKIDTGSKSEIYVSDFDGFGATAVTRDNNLVSAPCWVPGQLKLFYTSWKNGFADIFSHDLTTGNRAVFARYPGSNFSPAVSPDGSKVAMILSKGGSPDLYVCNIDGTGLKQLTRTKEDESSPCWSPDGRTICFVSTSSGRPALYTIPAAGGETRRLSTSGASMATEPDWSPDGKTIIFTRQTGGFEICTVPATGGEVTVLVSGEDPSWAPNSRTAVFTRRVGGRRILSLLDVPTKTFKDVAQISGSCSQPGWAR